MPNVLAFASFVLMTTFTPGPNNIMSMSNAGRYGFRRSMAFTTGVCVGFFLVVGLAIAFTVVLFGAVPTIKPVMTVLGAAYILWLAYKTLVSSPHNEDPSGSGTFLSGVLLQFLNPKAILYGLTAASTFIVPYYHSVGVLAGFAVLLALVSLVATSSWALFGSVFQRFTAEHYRAFGVVMAALLVYCAISLFV